MIIRYFEDQDQLVNNNMWQSFSQLISAYRHNHRVGIRLYLKRNQNGFIMFLLSAPEEKRSYALRPKCSRPGLCENMIAVLQLAVLQASQVIKFNMRCLLQSENSDLIQLSQKLIPALASPLHLLVCVCKYPTF